MKTDLGTWTIDEYMSAVIRGTGGSFMTTGSSNAMVTGRGFIRAFRGVTELSGKSGSRIFFLTDRSYAGLGTASVNAAGSVFNARELLLYIGNGQVRFNGEDLAGVVASSTLSLIKKQSGVYAAGSNTGPFQVGHAQPSAPTVYAKSSPGVGHTSMSGAVSVVTWRVSDITGQTSLRSLPSNVVSLSNQSVIVQVPLPDTNGQTHWGFGVPKLGFADLGVYYELPTSLNGEVAESTLSYTRTTGTASIADGTNVVDDPGGAFTSADIGRRYSFGAFDSWITAINSSTQVQVNDTNSSGGAISGAGTITHAVEGITRAVEISWANGSLIGQNIAPDKAFPPPAGQFAGVINDTAWIEADGIIYVGEPGQIGSFPPSNAVFPNEPAVLYLRSGDGLTLRFGKNSWGALAYVGGSPALEYQTLSENQGIMFPQNAALGAHGRLLVWFGKPAVIDSGIEPDFEYAASVMPDFEGWDSQTADAPVVPGYDGIGDYEVWFYERKAMAKHVPSNKWCAPLDLSDKVSGNVVAAFTHEGRLHLSCLEGSDLTIYQFDVGSGSIMTVQTSDVRGNGYGSTITEVLLQGRADNAIHPITAKVVTNYDDASPVTVDSFTPTRTGTQRFPLNPPNILDAVSHAVIVTLTSTGGDAGVDLIQTRGATSEVYVGA